MNKVILSGNLCKDIDLKYTSNNIAALQNTIAVKNDFKNKSGEYESQFINFTAYRTTAEYLAKYAAKGVKVLLEGRWSNRSYEKEDGTKVYISEVIVERAELVGAKKEENASNEKQDAAPQEEHFDPFADFGESIVINDEDLPF